MVFDINWTGSLGSLNYAFENELAIGATLPSWVTDWRSVPKDEFLPVERQARYKLYIASNGLKCEVMIYADKLLSVPCIAVDQVHLVGDLLDSGGDDTFLKTLLQRRSSLRFDEAPDQSYINGGTLEDAFWWKLMLDAVVVHTSGSNKYVRAMPEDRKGYGTWWNMLCGMRNDLPVLLEDPSFRRVHFAVPSATMNRRFFTTKKGFIGNGPAGIQYGDDVYIIYGANPLFALRRDERTFMIPPDSAPQPFHTLVGGCYLQGIMGGEAVIDSEKRKTQVYLI